MSDTYKDEKYAKDIDSPKKVAETPTDSPDLCEMSTIKTTYDALEEKCKGLEAELERKDWEIKETKIWFFGELQNNQKENDSLKSEIDMLQAKYSNLQKEWHLLTHIHADCDMVLRDEKNEYAILKSMCEKLAGALKEISSVRTKGLLARKMIGIADRALNAFKEA